MHRQANDTILLVEDGEAEVLLVQQAVAGCPGDLRLVAVKDSNEALAWINETIERECPMPRLILLDLKLPKLVGLAVLRTLRMEARLKDVPIVVFSESHEPADVVLSYQIGANSFVDKPSNLDDFTRLLNDLADMGWLKEDGLSRHLERSLQQ